MLSVKFVPNYSISRRNTVLKKKIFNTAESGMGMHFGCSTLNKITLPKQKLSDDLYQIDLSGYDKNTEWSSDMLNLTYSISKDISNNKDFDTIVSKISKKMKAINKNNDFCEPRELEGSFKIMKYNRGGEYLEKYQKKLRVGDCGRFYAEYRPQSNCEYGDAKTCEIISQNPDEILIFYGWNDNSIVSNLDLAKDAYNKLKSIKKPTLDDINKTCATIQWLIIQECPFKRGNDSFANVLTRAIYHSYGIKTTTLKNKTALDFEAFYTDLDEYIKLYPSFFKEQPHL